MITKLSIRFIEEDETYVKGIVFCSSNSKGLKYCPIELIVEALNDAGYYEDEFSLEDVQDFKKTIDTFGVSIIENGEITNKHFWFAERKQIKH